MADRFKKRNWRRLAGWLFGVAAVLIVVFYGGQAILAFPPVTQPFTAEDVGGWSQAYSELIDTLWQTEIGPRLDLEPAGKLLNAVPE